MNKKTEIKIVENEWFFFENRRPPEGERVLVFREQRKKFTIACLVFRKADPDDEIIEGWNWITEQRSAFDVKLKDQWLYFARLTESIIYK
jgi:hypothetical protein